MHRLLVLALALSALLFVDPVLAQDSPPSGRSLSSPEEQRQADEAMWAAPVRTSLVSMRQHRMPPGTKGWKVDRSLRSLAEPDHARCAPGYHRQEPVNTGGH
jgi:hypothetical protein